MKGLTRVIAIGNMAGEVVDYLRQEDDYDNADFWFLGSTGSGLLSHGYLTEPHIHIGKIFNTKYIEAIHVDNEMAAIVIASLDEDIAQTFLYDIVGEVWGYADKVYCFLILPTAKECGGKRSNAVDLFHKITDWSDITVLQENDDLPDNANFEDGIAQLLKCCLDHSGIDEENTQELMTTAEWTTVKQMWTILNSYIVKQMPAYLESATFSFHKRGTEEC